jgi:hypothetical protein
MEREGAPLSPDCVPALDIVLRAEARSVNGLESSQVGMSNITVLDERGNAVNLLRATPAHFHRELLPQTTIASIRLVAVVLVGCGTSPTPSVMAAERWMWHTSSNIQPHPESGIFVNSPLHMRVCGTGHLVHHPTVRAKMVW